MYQGIIRNVGVPTEYNRTKNLSKIRNYVLKFFSSDLSTISGLENKINLIVTFFGFYPTK